MNQRKRCSACKNELLLDKFNKNVSNKDGLQGECRECSNARARQKTADNNKAKAAFTARTKTRIKAEAKTTVIGTKLKEQAEQGVLILRAKGLFLSRLTRHMASENLDYKNIATMAGYSHATVSSYLNGPDKVSEQFIRQVSKKIPALAQEWLKFNHMINGNKPGEEPRFTLAPIPGDRYILVINGDVIDVGGSAVMGEAMVGTALNEFLNDEDAKPSEFVIEVFKLMKMGYELNIMHNLYITEKP